MSHIQVTTENAVFSSDCSEMLCSDRQVISCYANTYDTRIRTFVRRLSGVPVAALRSTVQQRSVACEWR